MKLIPAEHISVGEELLVKHIIQIMVYVYGMPEDILLEDFNGKFPEYVRVSRVGESKHEEGLVDIHLDGIKEPYSFFVEDKLYVRDTSSGDTKDSLVAVLERIATALESIDNKMR